MPYRPLGKCGTKVSAFGLGGWTTFGGSVTDEVAIREILRAAYEAGINFFDIADVYARGESERAMGKILKSFPRHELVISSKLFWPMSDDVNDRGLSRKHIFESVEKSLKRLETDYLDIYFCHRHDAETPLVETARAMDDLVHQGKVLYWGTSEWNASQLREANQLCEARNLYRPQVEQPQYSLLERGFEAEVRDTAMKNGMGVVVWSPLASGLLTGKYDHEVPAGSRLDKIAWLKDAVLTPERVDRVKRFKKISDAMGCSRAQLALAWAAAQPGVSSVITGATRVEQLRENLAALKLTLNHEVLSALDEIFPR
ncbi:MAG: aldo/keto reductase family protein, partial [Deltaproteobacteria bacterium]|nr:aldo/keto reductase family protein [Deltaproteobacteria bacterium]